jgi:steroid delta-isomerase-like uncharacterized protein
VTSQASAALMQRFVQFINTADPALADALIAPDAAFQVPGQPEPLRGPQGYLGLLSMLRGGFPDIQWTLEETVIEDDRVAARYTMRGTHRGTFFGVPATGRPIRVQSMAFYRIADGQFVAEHGMPDMLSLLQQIGAAPGP